MDAHSVLIVADGVVVLGAQASVGPSTPERKATAVTGLLFLAAAALMAFAAIG